MILRLRNQQCDSNLVYSSLHDQNDFYKVLEMDLRQVKQEVIIESPFVSYKRLNYMLPILKGLQRRNVQIVINTKHPDEQRETFSRIDECITTLQNMGSMVLFTGGHHRKLAILDREVIYEGSLNILSQNDSCEIMRRIESTQLARQMINFIGIKTFIN